jgi:hypothetical protein
MGFPRARFRLRSMIAAVAAAGLLSWASTEITVRGPEREHVRDLIRHHQIRAKCWELWAEEYFPPGSAHHDEYKQLATWHRERIQDLTDLRMPTAEDWWRRGAEVAKQEMDLFRRTGGGWAAPGQVRKLSSLTLSVHSWTVTVSTIALVFTWARRARCCSGPTSHRDSMRSMRSSIPPPTGSSGRARCAGLDPGSRNETSATLPRRGWSSYFDAAA